MCLLFYYISKGIFKFAIRRISPPNFLDQSSPKKKNLRISKVSIAPTSGNKHYVRPIPGKSAEFRPCEFTNLHYVFKRRVAHRRLSWTTKENRNTSAEINFKSCLPVWLSTRKQKPGNKKYFNYGVEERGTLGLFPRCVACYVVCWNARLGYLRPDSLLAATANFANLAGISKRSWQTSLQTLPLVIINHAAVAIFTRCETREGILIE
mgnify:CR=1 FL=1